jgi:hypothetical protein
VIAIIDLPRPDVIWEDYALNDSSERAFYIVLSGGMQDRQARCASCRNAAACWRHIIDARRASLACIIVWRTRSSEYAMSSSVSLSGA